MNIFVHVFKNFSRIEKLLITVLFDMNIFTFNHPQSGCNNLYL